MPQKLGMTTIIMMMVIVQEWRVYLSPVLTEFWRRKKESKERSRASSCRRRSREKKVTHTHRPRLVVRHWLFHSQLKAMAKKAKLLPSFRL